MTGYLSPEQIESVLRGQKIGRIGCYADGKVLISPLMYAYDGSTIYGHSDEGLKLQMMRKNPNVCFEVEQTASLSNWQTVVVWGTFELLNDDKDIAHAKKLLREQFNFEEHDPTRPSARMFEPTSTAVEMKSFIFRVKIQEKTGKFERTR